MGIAFIYWVNVQDEDNYWPGEGSTLKAYYNYKMDCKCEFFEVTNSTSGDKLPCMYKADGVLVSPYDSCCHNYDCLAGYMLWFSPFMAAVICFSFGLLAFL